MFFLLVFLWKGIGDRRLNLNPWSRPCPGSVEKNEKKVGSPFRNLRYTQGYFGHKSPLNFDKPRRFF